MITTHRELTTAVQTIVEDEDGNDRYIIESTVDPKSLSGSRDGSLMLVSHLVTVRDEEGMILIQADPCVMQEVALGMLHCMIASGEIDTALLRKAIAKWPKQWDGGDTESVPTDHIAEMRGEK